MPSPVRILQVIGSLDNGGSQAVVLNLYRNIDRSRIQFDFIVDHPKQMYLADEVRSLGAEIYFMPTFTGFNLVEVINAWNDFFDTHPQYKLIHTHVRSYAAVYLAIAKKHGLVTVSHSHSTSSGKGFKALVKNLLQKRLRRVSDYMMSCSEQAGIWLFGKKTVNSDRHFVLNNAIDMSRYKYNPETAKIERKILGISDDAFVVGHVGRFIKLKNHGFIVDVFCEILKHKPESYLILAGDGELLDEIKSKVTALGIENRVVFTGQTRRVPELLMSMDVLLFPSVYEGLPVTLVEAQATGLACVISDTVDKKCDLTGLITRVSLEKNASEWAKIAIDAKPAVREDTSEDLRRGGYDINNTAAWLTDFYIGLACEK